MRNLWKGLAVGAVTGVGVGYAIDWTRRRQPGDMPAVAGGVWKGFILGAVTGSGVGLIVDLAGRDLAAAAAHTGRAIREHGPDLAGQLAESDTVHAAAGAAQHTAHQAAESARTAGTTAAGLAKDVVHAVEDTLPAS